MAQEKDRPSEPGRRVRDAAPWKGRGGIAACSSRSSQCHRWGRYIGIISSVTRTIHCRYGNRAGRWFGLSRTSPAHAGRGHFE